MPVYEYECQSCRNIFEKWQSLADALVTTCPTCAGPTKKIISRTSFQLKGSGWYSDGYSNASPSKSTSSSETTATKDTPASPPAATPAASTSSSTDS